MLAVDICYTDFDGIGIMLMTINKLCE